MRKKEEEMNKYEKVYKKRKNIIKNIIDLMEENT